jgi:hypothetical protein
MVTWPNHVIFLRQRKATLFATVGLACALASCGDSPSITGTSKQPGKTRISTTDPAIKDVGGMSSEETLETVVDGGSGASGDVLSELPHSGAPPLSGTPLSGTGTGGRDVGGLGRGAGGNALPPSNPSPNSNAIPPLDPPPSVSDAGENPNTPSNEAPVVTWAEIQPILSASCVSGCHATSTWLGNETGFRGRMVSVVDRITRGDGVTGYMPKERRDGAWPAKRDKILAFFDSPAAPTGGGVSGGAGSVPDADKVHVFIAQGHAGRRATSCDGTNWMVDKSHDESIRCWTSGSANNVECDHNMFPGRGLAFASDGWVYAAHGWGQASTVVKSRNGVDWEPILRRNADQLPLLAVDVNTAYSSPAVASHSRTFAGLATFGARLLGGSSEAPYTDDRGSTWSRATAPNLDVGNYRESYQIRWNNKDRVFVFGDTNNDPNRKGGKYSDDGGTTWSAVGGWGPCRQGQLAFGNDVAVMLAESGGTRFNCVSSDGGANWSAMAGGGPASTTVVFGGGKFRAYDGNSIFESANGTTWTSASRTGVSAVNGSATSFSHVAYSAGRNRYVAITQGWGSWYDKQRAYHSADGVAWTASTLRGGHPITQLKAGQVAKSALCPN